jgi:hypothetical protein
MSRGSLLWVWVRALGVRLRLLCPNGPGPLHPESMTAELAEADEEMLAELDFLLWPQQSGHMLRYAFRRQEDP